MQIIVCDLASALEEGIYDYSERDLIYIPVKRTDDKIRFGDGVARTDRKSVFYRYL